MVASYFDSKETRDSDAILLTRTVNGTLLTLWQKKLKMQSAFCFWEWNGPLTSVEDAMAEITPQLLPGSKEEDFLRNNAFSPNDLYGHVLAQEPLPQGSWNLQFW